MLPKSLIFSLALATPLGLVATGSSPAYAEASEQQTQRTGVHHMPVGFHEFAIFGGEAVYISHYPMFSSIHAYQVVAQVRLTAADHDAERRFLDHRAAHPGLTYTLSPYRDVPPTDQREKDQADWVLPGVATAGRSFNGDIHYRDNGKDVTLDANVTVSFADVAVKSLLDPALPRPAALAYVLFGTGGDAYLVHVLSAPPNPGEQVLDFDQIVAVTLPEGTAKSRVTGPFLLTDRSNVKTSRLKPGDDLALTGPGGEALHVVVGSELFTHDVGTER